MVIFENPGEIDPRLIGTFGVNVKGSADAIGFFGTGLKYALAILARTDHAVTIQAGETVHTFARQPATIRGKAFEFVAMDGRELGFTTEIGKNWELWMAYRELFCNCQDEGGTVYEAAEPPAPEAGVTRVIVTGNAFLEVRRDHDRYFITGRPAWANSDIEVHPGRSAGVYYRDVLIGQNSLGIPTQHTYNLRRKITLTEDRTAKYAFEVDTTIARGLVQCEDPEIVRAAVTADDGAYEKHISFDVSGVTPSDAFIQVVGGLVRDRVGRLNPSAVKLYERHTKITAEPEPIALSPVEGKMMERARSFCTRMGFHIDQPVIVVESLGNNVFGMARNDRIYIAQRAFMEGTKQLAVTLIEEYLHLRHDLRDETREMQEYLLARLVSVGEELTGEPL